MKHAIVPSARIAVFSFTIMQYVRGTIFWKQQRLDEALVAARSAGATFSNRRDHDRWINARLLEGSILVDLHISDVARALFFALADDAEAMGDAPTRARIENNLASAYLDLGEIGNASKHFVEALRLYENLGIATEATRARWSIGVVALVSGNAADAARRLQVAKSEFEKHKMLGDAALVGLDLTKALVILGEHAEARRLAAEVLRCVKAAGMAPAALAAAAFLREAAESGALTPGVVDHVRGFLRRLEAHPLLRFEPPLQAG